MPLSIGFESFSVLHLDITSNPVLTGRRSCLSTDMKCGTAHAMGVSFGVEPVTELAFAEQPPSGLSLEPPRR